MGCLGSLLETRFILMLVNGTIAVASVNISAHTAVERGCFERYSAESRSSGNRKPAHITVSATSHAQEFAAL